MRRFAVLTIVVLAVAACGGQPAASRFAGTPAASAKPLASDAAAAASVGNAIPSAGAATPTGTAASGGGGLAVNLCSLLRWPDLGYPGIAAGAPSPTQSGKLTGWDQSCFWASQQFDAGYTPPHDASCDQTSGDAGEALRCVGVEAKAVGDILVNSKWVKLTVAWKNGISSVSPVSYTQDGNPVYLSDDPATASCTAGLNWADGTLAVADVDATKAFGPPCSEVKKVVALLMERQPR